MRSIGSLVAACLAGIVPIVAHANAIQAFATGNERITTENNTDLPANATGSVCAYAEAGGTATKRGGFFFGPTPTGTVGSCTITFHTEPLKTFVGSLSPGRGITGTPKFPPPLGTGAHNTASARQRAPNTTLATSSGDWVSGVGLTTIIIPFLPPKTYASSRSSVLTASADVTNTGPKPPGGTAAGEALDPWFFTPADNMTLALQVTLENVRLLAVSDAGGGAVAGLETVGAFGLGTQIGADVMANWSFSRVIVDNGMFDLASDTLFAMTLPLVGGNTYWMTDDLRTVAVAPVSEPTVWPQMLACVICVGVYRVVRRPKTVSLRTGNAV